MGHRFPHEISKISRVWSICACVVSDSCHMNPIVTVMNLFEESEFCVRVRITVCVRCVRLEAAGS